MGSSNSNCEIQNCSDGCCNYYGTCPSSYQSSSDPDYYSCEYYYESKIWIVGPVVGVVFFILLGVFIRCMVKKRTQQLIERREAQRKLNAANLQQQQITITDLNNTQAGYQQQFMQPQYPPQQLNYNNNPNQQNYNQYDNQQN